LRQVCGGHEWRDYSGRFIEGHNSDPRATAEMAENLGSSLSLPGHDFSRAPTRIEQEYCLERAGSRREEVNLMRSPVYEELKIAFSESGDQASA
jgi:hypothetical protein